LNRTAMQRSALRRAGTLVIAMSVAAALPFRARTAQADTERRPAAQALYDQAVDAMDRGDYVAACPALAEVVRLAPEGLGAKLTLARCYERAGQLASAWAMYAATEEAGLRQGRADRWQPARERRQALEPKLARLTLVVPREVRALPGLSVERDGVPVGAAQWQVAVPVDRGKHVITAIAAGKPRWEKAIEIGADGERVEVTIDGLRDAAAPAEARAPAASFWSARRVAGAAAGGLGVVGLGVGAVFGLVAAGKQSDSDDGHCFEGDRCDPAGRELRDEARAAGDVATVFFVAGGVLLGGGAVLFATAPGARKAGAEVAVVPGGLAVRGAF
jgi:hypothetical protein